MIANVTNNSIFLASLLSPHHPQVTLLAKWTLPGLSASTFRRHILKLAEGPGQSLLVLAKS
jgi:hypothetical protein